MEEKKKKDLFLSLLEPHFKQLQKFARALTKEKEDAKDLLQETLLRAFHNFEKLKDRNSFKSYIFSIAKNINSRAQWRKRLFSCFNYEENENISEKAITGEVNYDVEVLYKMLNKLPLKQREAVILFDILGFSIEEIKNIQGGTISGVKSRLKRGRESLKSIFKEEIDLLSSNLNMENNISVNFKYNLNTQNELL